MKSISNELKNKIVDFYNILKNKYPESLITEDRKANFDLKIQKYGYLPYPYLKALEELSEAETLYCLERKLEKEGTIKNGVLQFSDVSVLARNNVNNSSWIKREGHDIKLINLMALGNDNNTNFFDWLKQIIILPTGNLSNKIFNTTIYLTPFHPRAFGCAYIPQASCVDSLLEDKVILKETGLNADEQVKMFITLAQLAGHPVIYDILPQTGRYSKVVLANPSCVRWFDVHALIKRINTALDNVWHVSEHKVFSKDLLDKYSKEELNEGIEIYKKILLGQRKFTITEHVKEILKQIDNDINLRKFKKAICQEMQDEKNQKLIQKKAKAVIQKCLNITSEIITEAEIQNREEVELALIKNGLWPLPGGAWNSAGVPVFDKMAKNALYPIMKHYNYKNEDVTKSANLDCQSPFYFVFFENGKYNEEVIEFYINYVKNLVKNFNFDGVRIDHVNHVIDELSEKDNVPISYRIPKIVLKKLNDELKTISPYFVSIAEYMLWDNFYKEYHEDMNFDVLLGNDIPAQYLKTPKVIDIDNYNLAQYNRTLGNDNYLSVLKTYNNQDGEYKYLDQYPAQLGSAGALFKWFKYKFFPGGYYSQRPMMYVDGDESFSKGGIEETICNEVFLKRGNDYNFFAKFDAIDRFAKDNQIICFGEAHVLHFEEDGFVYWQIQNNNPDDTLLIIANYKAPKEKFFDDNSKTFEYKLGDFITNNTVQLNENYAFVSEYIFNGIDYVEEKFDDKINSLCIEKLLPAEFRIFKINKIL